jgi:hypothetical protein
MGEATVSVVVATNVKGKHCWPEAPEHRDYLRTPHLHDFRFVAHCLVLHDDRDIEFHDLKDRMKEIVVTTLSHNGEDQRTKWDKANPSSKPIIWYDFGRKSCEQLGQELMAALGDRCWKVEVYEDADDGAVVEHSAKIANQRMKQFFERGGQDV